MNGYKLYTGDCADILPTLGIEPDLILTSPPYDNLRDYGGHGFDFDRVADALVSVMKEGAVLVWIVADATIDGSETGTSFRQALAFMERGLKLHDTMIYRYRSGNGKTYDSRHSSGFEYMFVFANGRHNTFNPIIDRQNKTGGSRRWGKRTIRARDGELQHRDGDWLIPVLSPRDNVWAYHNGHSHSAPDMDSAHMHPAIFPLALARDHIRTWTNAGDLVLDPMAGSGTTLRAAKDLNRHAIGIEIHEPYVDLIHRRMAQEVMDMAI